MRFTPAAARAIIAGRKTTHRIPVRPGDGAAPGRYHPGSDHAVCPDGAPSIGRIVITRVDRCAVGTITETQAAAEGHANLVAFARAWLTTHDPAYRPALEHATDDEALDRFHTRHADRETWVLSFVVDPTAPVRLLAAHSEDGYVAHPYRALPDEPEAVDEQTQTALTSAAHQRRTHQTNADRRALVREINRLRTLVRQLRDGAAATTLTPHAQTALRRAESELRRTEHQLAQTE